MAEVELKLYISGKTARTERAVANLRRMLDGRPGLQYELSICDVLEQPQEAEDQKILATPTLILMSPLPAKRVIGDLFHTEKVLHYLGLTLGAPEQGEGSA
jgi:circadian clock protein KaiB